jgi:uncharacterized protein (TIGR01777 family)
MAEGGAGPAVRRVAIGGATGMLGTAVTAALRARGTEVLRLVRGEPSDAPDAVWWKPAENQIDEEAIAGVDAVLNFSGRTIDERWTDSVKQEIRQSRVKPTRLLAETVARMHPRPHTMLVASGINYYGDRDGEILDETQPRGHGFLADTVVAWESAADPAREAGIRVVNARFGAVLDPQGGALARMLPIFKLGAGGTLGDGRQWFSWVGLEDVVRAVLWMVDHPEIEGGVNVCSPNPVTNAEFTETLGRVLHRPTLARAPEFALKLVFGELAEEVLFASQRAVPRMLLDAGFTFAHPQLEGALRHALDS